MSREIHPIGPSGLTCHVHIMNYSGQRWNGTTFVDFVLADLSTYALSVVEDGSTGVYVANMPTSIPVGNYDIILYNLAEEQVGNQYIEWRGVGAGSVIEQVGDITYLDIKTQVVYNLGRGNDTDILAQISMWAKMSIRDVINWRDGWFLHAEATVDIEDGTQTYDLPTDYKGNLKIFIQKTDKWVELNGPIDLVEARRRFTPNSTGEPTDWSHYGTTQFKVWPVDPDNSFTLKLDYIRNITDLNNDSDTNTLTVQYPQLLIALMTKYGFKYLQEFQDAAEWEKEANRILMDLHANYVARTLGRDFCLGIRTDVLGHLAQSRGNAAYLMIR